MIDRPPPREPQTGPSEKRGRREPNSARTGGLPPSRVGQSQAPPPPPPANAESVIGFRTGQAVGGTRCNDGDRTRTDVPIWRAWRLSSADVLCRAFGARRSGADRQFWVPMTRRHPDLKQRRFIHEAEPIARPTGHGPIHLAKRIFNWRFASDSCELSSFTGITQRGMVGVADGVPDRRVRRRRPGSTSEPLPQRPGRGRGVARVRSPEAGAVGGRCPSERAPVCGDVGC